MQNELEHSCFYHRGHSSFRIVRWLRVAIIDVGGGGGSNISQKKKYVKICRLNSAYRYVASGSSELFVSRFALSCCAHAFMFAINLFSLILFTGLVRTFDRCFAWNLLLLSCCEFDAVAPSIWGRLRTTEWLKCRSKLSRRRIGISH